MRTLSSLVALALAAAVTVGCSDSKVSQVSPSGLAATLPNLPAADRPAEAPSDEPLAEEFAPPLPDSIDLFAPPKVVIPVVTKEPEPGPVEEPVEEDGETPPKPPLRLLGFVDVDGLKALLTVDGTLNIMTIGDSVSGVQVVAVEAPNVTLKHGDEEFQMNLFEQEWFYAASPSGPLLGQKNSFGGKPVQPAGSSGPSFPGGMPQLPGLPGGADGGDLKLPDLPDFPGSNDDEGGIPGLPGFGQGDDNELPNLPGMGDDEGGLPGLPDFDDDGEGGLPGLDGR